MLNVKKNIAAIVMARRVAMMISATEKKYTSSSLNIPSITNIAYIPYSTFVEKP